MKTNELHMISNEYRLENLEIQPEQVKVRSSPNLRINFSLNFDLEFDSALIVRFRGGRNNKNDWYSLQAFDPHERGYISLKSELSNFCTPILTTGKELSVKFIIRKPDGIKANSMLTLEVTNTLVQSMVEKEKVIEFFLESPAKESIKLGNAPIIEIIPAEFKQLTIIAPSTIIPKKTFRILIRAEDQFHNLVSQSLTSVSLWLVDSAGKEIPIEGQALESSTAGIIKTDGFDIKLPGIYRIKGEIDEKSFLSNPIFCDDRFKTINLYWGYIHGHTSKSDGVIGVHDYFRNLRKAGLDFGTSTEHDHQWETTAADFQEIKLLVGRSSKPGEFMSLFGYEYGTWYSGYGDICTYYLDDDIPLFRSDVNKYNSTPKLIKNLKEYAGKVMMVAHHTALRPGYRDWNYFNNDLERLVEIYSTWGNQEYSFKEGNPLPPRYKFFAQGPYAKKRGPILEKPHCFVQDALAKGYKLGFTAGGDDHYGVYPSGMMDPDDGLYPTGIMAVWAPALTKEALWNALYNRHCYGSTGPRIIVEFSLDGHVMGAIVSLSERPELNQERSFQFNLISPELIRHVEIIRNNELLLAKQVNSNQIDYNFTDDSLFDEIALKHAKEQERFVFYYLRIFLTGDNMAWSSPIWLTQNIP